MTPRSHSPMTPAERTLAMRNRLQAIQRKIDAMRSNNDENESDGPDRVQHSRLCSGCFHEPHGERYASLACGHAVCRWCAAEEPSCCLFCKAVTSYVRIYEDEGSRKCGICLTEQPLKRSLFSGCGHTLCDACIGQMWYNAVVYGQRFACHQCRRSSRPVQLREMELPIVIKRKNLKVIALRGKDQQHKGITKPIRGRQRRSSCRY